MCQKGRVDTRQGLLIGLLALVATATATAHAQVAQVDFQVIHLPRNGGSEVHYLAVRSQDEWTRFWQTGSLEPTLSGAPQPATARPSPPKIDFTRFILLIASTGVKPSSGYSNVFTSVDTLPASMAGAPPSKNPVTLVHIVEIGPGSCPVLTALMGSVSYALIPQTTNEIRFSISRADSNCSVPVNPPFIK
jgi:hypothetical protein